MNKGVVGRGEVWGRGGGGVVERGKSGDVDERGGEVGGKRLGD